MEYIISRTILEGAKILAIFKNGNNWIAISEKENIENFEFNESDFVLVDSQYLIDRIPKLKNNLDQPDKTVINVDYETGEVNFNKKHFHFGIPTHKARASRQANTEFSFINWIKFNTDRYRNTLIWVIVLLIVGYFFGWMFYVLIPIPLAIRYLIDSKERDMYYSGALLPGIVIDEKRSLIAVLTDLSLGIGRYPIVRIQNVKIPSSHKLNSTKLAIAGAYMKTKDYPHWNCFESLVLLTGMKYPNKHQDLINQIPTIEWIKLRNEIKSLKMAVQPGYFPIKVDETNWNSIDLEKVHWVE